MSNPSRQALIADLRHGLSRWEAERLANGEEDLVSTGSVALDHLLPRGGVRRGSIVEYLASSAAQGAGTLALAAAREACGSDRALVVVEVGSGRRTEPKEAPTNAPSKKPTRPSAPPGHFYPPAAAAWGIDLARLVVLRPTTENDALWALDQALRCPGVGAVWARWNEFDARDFRRLQLAAEAGRTLGLLLRPARRRGRPTWAQVQWLITTVPHPSAPIRRPSTFDFRSSTHHDRSSTWKLHVELTRCQGGSGGRSVLLEFEEATREWQEVPHATNPLPPSAQLAHPAPPRRA